MDAFIYIFWACVHFKKPMIKYLTDRVHACTTEQKQLQTSSLSRLNKKTPQLLYKHVEGKKTALFNDHIRNLWHPTDVLN